MVGVSVAVAVVTVCACLAVLVGVRLDRHLRARVAAMPGSVEPAAFWPVDVDESQTRPYLRGATVASALTGRR